MAKRGRKKLTSGIPINFDFWHGILDNEYQVNDFLIRGDQRQHECMIRTLNYLRQYEEEYFIKIDGENILKRLKNVNI